MPRPGFPPIIPIVRPGFAHAASRIEFQGSIPIGADFPMSVGTSQFAHGMTSMQHVQLPTLVENVYMAAAASTITNGDENVDNAFRNIASMMGLDQPSDGGNDTDSDESVDVADEGDDTEGETGGQPAAKKSRKEEEYHVAKEHEGEDVTYNADQYENDKNVLPDLPQPKSLAEKGPSDFTAQEHIFLAWAKTMSTFTAKRQAAVKMQINKIMSEAEFEDLDDEFFAGNITFPCTCGICHNSSLLNNCN